jgi:hypothetical protein
MENPEAFLYPYNLNVLDNMIKVNNSKNKKQQKQQIFKIDKCDFLNKKQKLTIIDKIDDHNTIKKNWTEEEVKLYYFKNNIKFRTKS